MNGNNHRSPTSVRGTKEGFESKIIPFFQAPVERSGAVAAELYLHGLSKGDFEMALRGLLGAGAPLSASAIERLKAKWQC